MKKNTFLLGLVVLLFLFACKQSSELKKTMKQAQKIAKNAKQMQKEEAKKSDSEKKKLFSEELIKAMNLKNTKNLVDTTEFEKVKKCEDAYKALSDSEKEGLTNEKLTELFKPIGFSTFDTAYKSIKTVAAYNEFLMSAELAVSGFKTVRLIDGEEGYNKAVKGFADKINEKGYTANDLRNIEKYKDVIGNAVVMTIKLQPYLKKKE